MPVPSNAKLSVNQEWYPVKKGRVPAKWIRKLTDAEISQLRREAAEQWWAQHPEDRA